MTRWYARFTTCLLLCSLAAPAVAQSRTTPPATARVSPFPTPIPDVVYGHKDGMALTFDVFRPNKANGAGVLFMVSAGWYSTWVAPDLAVARFAGLLDKGFTVFAVRHGSSPRYNVPEAAADVERAVRYVRLNAANWAVDPDRLGVYGGSAGGHLSLMLGLDPDSGNANARDAVLRTKSGVAAVVAYFPPVDLRPLVGPSERFPALNFSRDLAATVSPILFVSADDPPSLLIHGDADRLVPMQQSVVIHDALKKAGVATDFIVIPGGDHGFTNPAHSRQAESAMIAWFERWLIRR